MHARHLPAGSRTLSVESTTPGSTPTPSNSSAGKLHGSHNSATGAPTTPPPHPATSAHANPTPTVLTTRWTPPTLGRFPPHPM